MKKYISKPLYLLAFLIMVISSCNNTETSKPISTDSSEKKFNPAGEQKNSSTYNPNETATDTMYKNKDSIPK